MVCENGNWFEPVEDKTQIFWMTYELFCAQGRPYAKEWMSELGCLQAEMQKGYMTVEVTYFKGLFWHFLGWTKAASQFNEQYPNLHVTW